MERPWRIGVSLVGKGLILKPVCVYCMFMGKAEGSSLVLVAWGNADICRDKYILHWSGIQQLHNFFWFVQPQKDTVDQAPHQVNQATGTVWTAVLSYLTILPCYLAAQNSVIRIPKHIVPSNCIPHIPDYCNTIVHATNQCIHIIMRRHLLKRNSVCMQCTVPRHCNN